MEPEKRLLLLRHAEVDEAYHRTFGGVLDINLSENGRNQAASLSPFIQQYGVDAIYSSPMRRVQQTLEPITNHLQLLPTITHKLREVDFGIWTGLTWEQVHDKHGLSPFDWLKHIEHGTIPNAEPMDQFRNRVGDIVQSILSTQDQKRILIACHGGVIRMILAHLLDLPLRRMEHFDIDYASLTEIHVRPEKHEIKLLNFRPWSPHPTYH